MKFIAIVFLAVPAMAQITETEPTKLFAQCYNEKSAKVPTQEERDLLDAYTSYFSDGSATAGEKVVAKLLALKEKSKGKFSVQWVSFFEGNSQLCCSSATSSCTESFGSMSLKNVFPRVKKGYATAIEIVLLYSALATTDGGDASGLRDYQAVIKEKHPWAIASFKKKYKDLLKDYPIQWL